MILSKRVKGSLRRAFSSLSPRKPCKAMRFLYSTTSTAVVKTVASRKMSRKPFLMFCHQKLNFVEDQAGSARL